MLPRSECGSAKRFLISTKSIKDKNLKMFNFLKSSWKRVSEKGILNGVPKRL